MKLKSWKTTSAGVIMVIGGFVRLAFAIRSGNFSEEAIMTSATAIVTGVGLLFAKDTDVTGGTTHQ